MNRAGQRQQRRNKMSAQIRIDARTYFVVWVRIAHAPRDVAGVGVRAIAGSGSVDIVTFARACRLAVLDVGDEDCG